MTLLLIIVLVIVSYTVGFIAGAVWHVSSQDDNDQNSAVDSVMPNYPFLNWELFKAKLMSQVGKPYVFGAEVDLQDQNPKAFDCSELVEWGYAQIGVTVADGSQNQYDRSVPVTLPQVGDVGFFKRGTEATHHVGMLITPIHVIEARGAPYNAVILRPRENWEKWGEFTGWRRFTAVLP